MLQFLKRLFSGRSTVLVSLDSLRFDWTGYVFRGEIEPARVRVWCTADGDSVKLGLIVKPTPLPSTFETVAELRLFHQAVLEPTGATLVEATVCQASNCRLVRVIYKIAQSPAGMTYVGMLTVPFQQFSFVITATCEERGMTGVRESILFSRRPETGQVDFVGFDPDAQVHDAEFPDHPVSRMRRILDRIVASLVLDAEVAKVPSVPLPA